MRKWIAIFPWLATGFLLALQLVRRETGKE